MSNRVLTATAVLARASRKGEPPARLPEARRELATVKIEEYVKKALATAPPLSAKQKARIADVLRNGGGNNG